MARVHALFWVTAFMGLAAFCMLWSTGDAVDSSVTVTAHVGTSTPPPPPPSSGGGGNSSGSGRVSATVTFTGRAYPVSKVSILRDGELAVSTTAGQDANFRVSLQRLPAGTYTFSAYAEDDRGIRSPALTFPVTIAANATILASGIFLAPTIATDKSQVRHGDPIMVLGKSAPSSSVSLVINSETPLHINVQSESDGSYFASVNTLPLEFGNHTVRARTSFSNMTTPESTAVRFAVGTRNVATIMPKSPEKGDMNGDARVNLVDFSVLAFWYKRSSPPAGVDLNNDGMVSLVDFSILAYYWTG